MITWNLDKASFANDFWLEKRASEVAIVDFVGAFPLILFAAGGLPGCTTSPTRAPEMYHELTPDGAPSGLRASLGADVTTHPPGRKEYNIWDQPLRHVMRRAEEDKAASQVHKKSKLHPMHGQEKKLHPMFRGRSYISCAQEALKSYIHVERKKLHPIHA
jgi:hypothetical protein